MNNNWMVETTTLNSVAGLNSLRSIGAEERDNADYVRGMAIYSQHFDSIPPAFDYSIFQYTLEGEGLFRHGENEYKLKPGSAFICNTTDPLASYCYPPQAEGKWRFVYASMRGPQIKAIADHLAKQDQKIISFERQPEIINRLQSFSRFKDKSCLLSASEANAIASSIVQLIIEHIEQGNLSTAGGLVDAVKAEVKRSLEQALTVAELAKRLNVSREHLSRSFAKATGITPHNFILEQKITFAAKLLLSTNLSCKEVSARLGFSSQHLFSENFKRIMGTPPGLYREMPK